MNFIYPSGKHSRSTFSTLFSRAFFPVLVLFFSEAACAQITIGFQGGETGDTWNFTATTATTLSQTEATQTPNKVTGTRSLVVGGNTGGGNCFASGSGNGTATAHTFTFSPLNISGSAQFTRTLTFNWGNRFPACNGTGWDSGENLVFTAFHNGIAQTPVTIVSGSSNAAYSILSNHYTWSIPPCVSQFHFVLTITTNRADELLFIDNVKMTTPQQDTPLPQPSAISGNSSLCQGANATYSVIAEAGIIYTWAGLPSGAAFTSPNGTTGSATIDVNWGTAAPGTYNLSVTPSNTCGSTGTPSTISVTILPAPAPVTISGPTSICTGQTITLTSSYATGNTWSTGATTPSVSVSAPGTYSISTATSCGTVTANHTVTITPVTPASITASGPTSFCPGGSVTLTSASATGNSWSTGSTDPSVTVTAAGTYTLTVTDACGTSSASEQVTLLPPPTATITAGGPTAICPSGSVQLTASGGPTYQWSTGATSTSITVTTPGTYTVTAFNSCGQATSAPLTVTQLPLPVPQITGTASFCAGQQTTLTASGGDTYQWSTGATSTSLTVTTAGNYTVTAFNSCGQATSAPFTVTQLPLPVPQITGTASFCAGQQTTLTASGGDTYQWSTGTTSTSLTVSAAGNYTITAFNSCGQTTSTPFAVTELPLPAPQITGTASFCAGQQTTLTASGGDTYQWSTGATSTSLTVTTAGNYTVTAFNSCGQTTSAPFAVSELPLPDAQIAGASVICENGQAQLTASGGTSYQWVSGQNTAVITITSPGTYTVAVTNSCGTSVASNVVTQSPLPVAQISGTASFCEGGQTTLTTTGGGAYLWSTGQTSPAITVNSAGVYTVSVTNSCGTDAASLTVTVSSVTAAFTADPSSGAAPLPVSFTNTSSADAISYNWDFNDGSTSPEESPVHSYNQSGNYIAVLTVTSAAGCSDSYSLLINVLDLPSSLRVPNVFTPNGDHVNDEFIVAADRIESYHLQILNRWGNIILTTDDPALGWDGTINGDPATEGTYFYQLTATGTDKKDYTETGFFVLQR